ncbi:MULTISPECIES: S-layer homology domain-containing protein [Paenibacillus]|uniref:S-layer homology domain-containing protein n=1 Tax=Paenibacillus TaxID=44249 RepID=UPI0022B8F45D|nr:S-layer homology domain-containing protein [Paenibacillus caseinilyticus]MCZ8523326.1 S-layer homology domain-containing protein [Paenibacillus caseinilyticus]
MKKSLSAIVSLAMAFSMFSSVALGATSADFKDLNDLDAATKAKFDAMITAGVFDGVSADTFGLKDKMNRAQFAKVAALIFGLKVDTSLKTSSFSDVKTEADDPANGYALPYIEALKAAGLTDGYAPGQYNPAGEVTKQELATFLVRGLKWESQVKSDVGVSDKTVSDWAKGYVALAIEKKILTSGEDGTFGGTSAATRDLLVTAAYEAQQAFKNENRPAKASVAEAKATGAKQVTVTFDRDVDTAKAKLSLKRGGVDVAVESVKFADDKKSVVLTTETRLTAGTYTATLSGLEAAEIDKATAEFTAQDETVQKLEFVNANDTVAKTNKAIIKLKASNQYGENTTLSASAYTVFAPNTNATLKKNDAGELLLTLDTTSSQFTPFVSIIPVNVYVNDNRGVSVTKNFKLGSEPFISKVELGTITYSNKKDSLSGTGEYATADLLQYDQYGNLISFDSTKVNAQNVLINFNPYEGNLVATPGDSNNDEIADIKFTLKANVDKSGDYTFTVNSQAGTATGTLKVGSTKVATKLEIGEMNNVIAAGDADAYVPLVAYDAAGNKLSIEDLTSEENIKRINVTVGGAKNNGIQTSGEHKGTIKLTEITPTSKGVVTVTAMIATVNVTSVPTKTYTVQSARYPDHFKVTTDPAKKIVPGAESAFEFEVLDQYGKELKELKNVDANGNVVGGTSNYQITVTASTYSADGTTIGVRPHDDLKKQFVDQFPGGYFPASLVLNGNLEKFTKEHKFIAPTTATKDGNFTAIIQKRSNDGTTWTEVSKLTRDLKIASKTEDLTYSVEAVSDLFNALDSDSVTDLVYGSDVATTSKFAKEIKVVATDAAGDKVAIPKNITSAQAAPSSVAQAGRTNEGKAFVIGNKKGAATVNIQFSNYKGETVTKQISVNVKDDALTTTKIAMGDASKDVTTSSFNIFDVINVKVTDNYGVTYEDDKTKLYNPVLGVTFAVTNIRTVGGAVTSGVTIDSAGNLQITGGDVYSFDVTATTPAGFSASTAFTYKK